MDTNAHANAMHSACNVAERSRRLGYWRRAFDRGALEVAEVWYGLEAEASAPPNVRFASVLRLTPALDADTGYAWQARAG